MDQTAINSAREKYRPEKVAVLFIAEAPPCTEGQFFYFEDVPKHDNLFLYLIRAVFPDLNDIAVKDLRTQKPQLLERFKAAGYFLEDSVAVSIPKGTTVAKKEKLIKENQQDLLRRIENYKESAVVLLSSSVFKTNFDFLKEHFTILNEAAIPFPGSGQQNKFKTAIEKLAL